MANWEETTKGLAQDGFNLAVADVNFVKESFSEGLRLAGQGLKATGEGFEAVGKGIETMGQTAINATASKAAGIDARDNLGSAEGEFRNISPATTLPPKLTNI